MYLALIRSVPEEWYIASIFLIWNQGLEWNEFFYIVVLMFALVATLWYLISCAHYWHGLKGIDIDINQQVLMSITAILAINIDKISHMTILVWISANFKGLILYLTHKCHCSTPVKPLCNRQEVWGSNPICTKL